MVSILDEYDIFDIAKNKQFVIHMYFNKYNRKNLIRKDRLNEWLLSLCLDRLHELQVPIFCDYFINNLHFNLKKSLKKIN